MFDEEIPLDADELMNFADRIEQLPDEDARWVNALFQECMRARIHEAELIATQEELSPGNASSSKEELAQVVLDAAEWLKTLWNVGYMGANGFPSQPCSAFPMIEIEDILNSALFARIREGKKPLPFPPPTRHGSPWHDLLESSGQQYKVGAEIVKDGKGCPIGAIIDACTDWHVIEEIQPDKAYIVQHRGKGPRFKLMINGSNAVLEREPPRWTRKITMQERGGFKNYLLEWPKTEGGRETQMIPLRAMSWERAESEAAHWVATKHPEMYGQIYFERVE